MCRNRVTGSAQICLRFGLAQCSGRVDVEPDGDVPGQRIVRSRLIGDEVEGLSAPRELRHDFRGISEQADRQRPTLLGRSPNASERVVDGVDGFVEVARVQAALNPRGIDLDAEHRGSGHRPGKRLRSAHAAEPRRQDRPAREVRRSEVLLAGGGEGLVGALEDPLGADVDPAPGRHLTEHRQPESLQPAKLVPRRPARHEQRIRDQHPRSGRVRPEHANRLAALDEQRLVLTQAQQAAHKRSKRLRIARRLAGASVDDELLRALRDLGIEVVQQHPERRFGRPRPRVQLRPAGRADPPQLADEGLHPRLDRINGGHRLA